MTLFQKQGDCKYNFMFVQKISKWKLKEKNKMI